MDGQAFQKMFAFRYFGCKIFKNDMDMDFAKNIADCNRLSGHIKSNFRRSIRVEVKQRLHDILLKCNLTYDCESWVL
jgi:hypothetical protein